MDHDFAHFEICNIDPAKIENFEKNVSIAGGKKTVIAFSCMTEDRTKPFVTLRYEMDPRTR